MNESKVRVELITLKVVKSGTEEKSPPGRKGRREGQGISCNFAFYGLSTGTVFRGAIFGRHRHGSILGKAEK